MIETLRESGGTSHQPGGRTARPHPGRRHRRRTHRQNPCRATSIVLPKIPHAEIQPWPAERVAAVTNTLPARYRILAILAAGCGLRQGEIFGLALDDIDPATKKLHIRQQVKQLNGRLIFALPKHDRQRDVPLPDSVAAALATHLHDYPARTVTLPWGETDGPPRTLRLVVTSREHKALNRNYINAHVWKPALERHGIIDPHRPTTTGRRDQTARRHGMHALRHYYASVLLDADESIKAVAKYLGHADPGFTLRTYTHLMPASDHPHRHRHRPSHPPPSTHRPTRPLTAFMQVDRLRGHTYDV
jgi:integrase